MCCLVPASRGRFADLLKSITDVKILTAHDVVNFDIHSRKGKLHSCCDVKVVHLGLEHMSRGLRPERVPDRAYRVRVGRDSSIADLVSALHQQAQYDCICFDFGGEFIFVCMHLRIFRCVEDCFGRRPATGLLCCEDGNIFLSR